MAPQPTSVNKLNQLCKLCAQARLRLRLAIIRFGSQADAAIG